MPLLWNGRSKNPPPVPPPVPHEETKPWPPSVQAYLLGPFGRVEVSGELKIGRKPDNKLVITDPLVSGYHAKIRPLDKGYSITDLGSANKTIINEKEWLERDMSRALKPGDVIRIGTTKFTYNEGRERVVPPAPSLLDRLRTIWNTIGQSRAAKVIIALILIVALISGTSLFEVNALSHLNIAGTGTPTPAPTTQPTTPPTVQPTTPPTVQPTSSPQNPVWNVILNRAASSLTYNNFTVTDTVGHHFLVITLSFANNTPQTQPINGNLLDLQDSAGDHYQEDQASNPQKTFNVLSGQSIELTIAYVVPDTQCQYTLVFNDPTGQPMSWNIQIDRAFCTA